MHTQKLWIGFVLVILLSFGVLGWFGREIYREAPPIPEKIISSDGNLICTESDIRDGQNVWQSIGGQEVGTIWGHGAYKAPDWTADWLHREAIFILKNWANTEYSTPNEQLNDELQALLQKRLQNELRKNTYDRASKIITISEARAEAYRENSRHYAGLFMDDPSQAALQEA